MKKKVIIYGLGANFWADYDAIHEMYEVIGYCDRDERKLSSVQGTVFFRSQLKKALADCDFLLG